MILVDTSVWAEHIRSSVVALQGVLDQGEAAVHDFVIGELLLGHIKRGATFMMMLDHLARTPAC